MLSCHTGAVVVLDEVPTAICINMLTYTNRIHETGTFSYMDELIFMVNK